MRWRCRAAVLAVVAVALLLPACTKSAKHAAAPRPASSTASAPPTSTISTPTTSAAAPAPADSTLVVTARDDIPSFASPGGSPAGTVPGTWLGAPSTLPVIAQQPGWFEVRLAQRPNGSTAWVRDTDVDTAVTPYRIVIDLATNHLTLYRSGQPVLSAPVGTGLPAYPTPTGQYFVALLAAPPNPGYGTFVMVTSAHSNTITDWENSGDALDRAPRSARL